MSTLYGWTTGNVVNFPDIMTTNQVVEGVISVSDTTYTNMLSVNSMIVNNVSIGQIIGWLSVQESYIENLSISSLVTSSVVSVSILDVSHVHVYRGKCEILSIQDIHSGSLNVSSLILTDSISIGQGYISFLDASSLQVDGSAYISGNLTVMGTQTILHTESTLIHDPVLVIGDGNLTDNLPLGVVAQYSTDASSAVWSGLIRNQNDKSWWVVENEPSLETITFDASYQGSLTTNQIRTNLIQSNAYLDLSSSLIQVWSPLSVQGSTFLGSTLSVFGNVTSDQLIANSISVQGSLTVQSLSLGSNAYVTGKLSVPQIVGDASGIQFLSDINIVTGNKIAFLGASGEIHNVDLVHSRTSGTLTLSGNGSNSKVAVTTNGTTNAVFNSSSLSISTLSYFHDKVIAESFVSIGGILDISGWMYAQNGISISQNLCVTGTGIISNSLSVLSDSFFSGTVYTPKLTVDDDIRHNGNDQTKITFTTDNITLNTNGNPGLVVTNTTTKVPIALSVNSTTFLNTLSVNGNSYLSNTTFISNLSVNSLILAGGLSANNLTTLNHLSVNGGLYLNNLLSVNGNVNFIGQLNLSGSNVVSTNSLGTTKIITTPGYVLAYANCNPSSPYNSNIVIDLTWNDWGNNHTGAMIDLKVNGRIYGGNFGHATGYIIFEQSTGVSTFTNISLTKLDHSHLTITATSPTNFVGRITINADGNCDRMNIHLMIPEGGTGTSLNSISITSV